jgi:hypothetical protein
LERSAQCWQWLREDQDGSKSCQNSCQRLRKIRHHVF